MKFFKVIIPVIISVLIAMSNLTSFYVSAEETTDDYWQLHESEIAVNGFTYSDTYKDLYNHAIDYMNSVPNFSGNISGFFVTFTTSTYSFYYIFFKDDNSMYVTPSQNSQNIINITTSNSTSTFCGLSAIRYSTSTSSSEYYTFPCGCNPRCEQGVMSYNQDSLCFDTGTYFTDGAYSRYLDSSVSTLFGRKFIDYFAELTFTVTPDFSQSMDLSSLSQNFSINVDNPTNKNYNYMIYISPYAASINLSSSANNMRYCLSSTQWAMQYSWKSSAMSASDVGTSVVDWVLNNYGPNIYNTWGGIVNIGKQFISSQDDGFYYYQLGQCKCPFYLITSKDTKSHVINYSDLGLDLNTDYFLNIIYYDVSNFGIAPTSTKFENLPDPASSAASRYSRYPIFNLSLISNYSVYSSTQFKITNGILNKNDVDIYKYDDVIKNSDPGSASAIISSDDDNVLLNTNSGNSYDSSVKTSYVNYGTIYHGCSISYCGSSSGTIGLPSPDFNYDFEEMIDQTGTFIDLIKTVLSSAGFLPVTLITAAVAVAVYCRILGR